MTPHDQAHHAIDYIELSVTDLEAAKSFYATAVGWSFNDYGPEYTGIRKNGGGEMGGLRPVTSVVTGGPLIILYSHDLEASLKAVRDVGGSITLEIFSFPGGRRFQFTDPDGNELAIWSDR